MSRGPDQATHGNPSFSECTEHNLIAGSKLLKLLRNLLLCFWTIKLQRVFQTFDIDCGVKVSCKDGLQKKVEDFDQLSLHWREDGSERLQTHMTLNYLAQNLRARPETWLQPFSIYNKDACKGFKCCIFFFMLENRTDADLLGPFISGREQISQKFQNAFNNNELIELCQNSTTWNNCRGKKCFGKRGILGCFRETPKHLKCPGLISRI